MGPGVTSDVVTSFGPDLTAEVSEAASSCAQQQQHLPAGPVSVHAVHCHSMAVPDSALCAAPNQPLYLCRPHPSYSFLFPYLLLQIVAHLGPATVAEIVSSMGPTLVDELVREMGPDYTGEQGTEMAVLDSPRTPSVGTV
jgi:hypothetical protein